MYVYHSGCHDTYIHVTINYDIQGANMRLASPAN